MVELKHKFTDSFFEEEDRLGFHIDRQRKEIWAVELDMLFELNRVCKKLNIRYFLDGGTLLGAARDGRFIPWDDDIDVAMLRADYDRFVREAPGEFEPPLFLQTGYTDKEYFRDHSQLRNSETCAIIPGELGLAPFNQGIFLDIFVLDDLFPENVAAQYAARDALWEERRSFNDRSFGRHTLIRWAEKQIRYQSYQKRFGSSEKFYAAMEDIFRADQKSELVDYLMLNRNADQVHQLKRSWYEESIPLSFEGGLFPAPKGYRDYLVAYYGIDWETPKQTSSLHNAAGQVIYDTNRSFREILEEIETTPDLYYDLISRGRRGSEDLSPIERKPKISVIMPSLNVAEYIRECMESVVNQTLREIEIICIDSGSTDGTLEILQEYAEKDSRIRLLHSDMRSYGHQVNMGFDIASGEYIAIVETDDYIDTEMYRKMYAVAVNSGFPDVLKSPYYSINPPEEDVAPLTVDTVIQAKTGSVFPLSAHYKLICTHPSIWSAIYKKEFLDRRQIRMMECPGGAWVDNPFLFRTMCEAERIGWIDEPFYYYRRTNPNASTRLKNCSIPFDRVNNIKDYLEENYPDDRLLEKHLFFRLLLYIEQAWKNPNLTDENRKQIWATVKRFRPSIAIRSTLGRQYRMFLYAQKKRREKKENAT